MRGTQIAGIVVGSVGVYALVAGMTWRLIGPLAHNDGTREVAATFWPIGLTLWLTIKHPLILVGIFTAIVCFLLLFHKIVAKLRKWKEKKHPTDSWAKAAAHEVDELLK